LYFFEYLPENVFARDNMMTATLNRRDRSGCRIKLFRENYEKFGS
jgi:hypothetical protein